MPVDTLLVYCGVYDRGEDAQADYDLVKELHTEAGLIDVTTPPSSSERRRQGQDREEARAPTWVGGVLGGGIGLATGRSSCSSAAAIAAASFSGRQVPARCSAPSPARSCRHEP